MIEHTQIDHHIQKYIIGILMYKKYARFRDLRPPKTDTNLFSYHLKTLQKTGFVIKSSDGYTLSQKGLSYVDRLSNTLSVRLQPKIICMLVIQDGFGKILLQKRHKQPYIDTWTLPNGKLHIEDASIHSCAMREALEKVGIKEISLEYAGDAYIRVYDDEALLTLTLTHIFRGTIDQIDTSQDVLWVDPRDLAAYDLAPAVEQVIARSFFGDPLFFEEFTVQLNV